MPSTALSQLAALTHRSATRWTPIFTARPAAPSGRNWLSNSPSRPALRTNTHSSTRSRRSCTCACFGLNQFTDQLHARAIDWLLAGADPLVTRVIRLARGDHATTGLAPATAPAVQQVRDFLDSSVLAEITAQIPHTAAFADAALHFYELFLATYDGSARKAKGVFFTPRALVSFIVRSVHEALQHEFGCSAGLADTISWREFRAGGGRAAARSLDTVQDAVHDSEPFVRILDPAMGSGAFLLECLETIHTQLRPSAAGSASPPDDHHARDQWDHYVAHRLLPRLWGQELMLPSLVLGQLILVAWLAQSGFTFAVPGQLQCHLANTLRQPSVGGLAAAQTLRPFTVVLGNPPFSGVSTNRQAWMRKLLRGQAPGTDAPVASYFHTQGQPLGERKHWLEDDYVKFIRFAHWQIEQAGAGVVGLVTNHGYLNNATFRGLREQLLQTFRQIQVVDLHGNSRSGERTPGGAQDQSVFGIEQGVAISLLRCGSRSPSPEPVVTADLWGTRGEKLAALNRHTACSLGGQTVRPSAPYFLFTAQHTRVSVQYQAGFRLCDIMPLHSTAVVTARDSFIVGLDRDELGERLRCFVDPAVSDDEIRARYFHHTRSRSYAAGDTRGWQLARARQQLRAQQNWQQHIRPCLYRPFDHRQILWLPFMIDWPRSNVMDHLARPGNLALITRRQLPPDQPCNYFWVTDTVTLDGVVRSDNRGSESVFPLLLNGPQPGVNFTAEFLDYCCRRLQLDWSPNDADNTQEVQLTPRRLFYYIYALFHCPSYRTQFAAELRMDFPRVLVPGQAALFHVLAAHGRNWFRSTCCAARRTSKIRTQSRHRRLNRGGSRPAIPSTVTTRSGSTTPFLSHQFLAACGSIGLAPTRSAASGCVTVVDAR